VTGGVTGGVTGVLPPQPASIVAAMQYKIIKRDGRKNILKYL